MKNNMDPDDHSNLRSVNEQVVQIDIDLLQTFQNHPFKIKKDVQMDQLMKSIETYGVMDPLIVAPTKDGYYRIISGHRRRYCAQQLGYKKVPAIVRSLADEDAVIAMVDANLHREKLLFSEKAFAYSMKNEAMKQKTGEKDKDRTEKTVVLIGKEVGESPRQIHRFIRLTKLIPELLKMLDEGQLSFNPAVDLSFLTEEEQFWVLDAIAFAQSSPSLSQTHRMKELSQRGKLTEEKIIDILCEIKKSETSRVEFKNAQIYRFFPREYSAEKVKHEILRILDIYFCSNAAEQEKGRLKANV